MYLVGCILIPFGAALLCLLSRQQVVRTQWISLGAGLAQLACATGLFRQVLDEGYVSMQPGLWPAPGSTAAHPVRAVAIQCQARFSPGAV